MHKLFYDIDLTLILGDAFVFLSVFYWCTAIQFLEEFVEIWGVTKADGIYNLIYCQICFFEHFACCFHFLTQELER